MKIIGFFFLFLVFSCSQMDEMKSMYNFSDSSICMNNQIDFYFQESADTILRFDSLENYPVKMKSFALEKWNKMKDTLKELYFTKINLKFENSIYRFEFVPFSVSGIHGMALAGTIHSYMSSKNIEKEIYEFMQAEPNPRLKMWVGTDKYILLDKKMNSVKLIETLRVIKKEFNRVLNLKSQAIYGKYFCEISKQQQSSLIHKLRFKLRFSPINIKTDSSILGNTSKFNKL